ncbi:MAG: hypothetical protein U0Q03_13725 [Acidimicrobiales bacterium]
MRLVAGAWRSRAAQLAAEQGAAIVARRVADDLTAASVPRPPR